MGNEQQQHSPRGFLGFMSTIPGILTGLAAIVTAASGIYLGQHNSAPSGTAPVPVPPATSTTTNLRPDGGSPPTSTGTVDQGNLRLQNAKSASGNDPVNLLIRQCAAGDDDACLEILETLAKGCDDGYGLDCDVLYEVSPVGSAYEDFGATCGDRFSSWEYADTCDEQ